MNDKIAKSMLGLCIGYLSVFYVLKFFFPELLIQVIASPTLIRLGEVLNEYYFLSVIFQFISSFTAFFLFACASSGKFKVGYKKIIILIAIVVLNNVIYYLLPQLYTHTSTSLMFVSALIFGGNLKYTTITFVIHGYLLQFLLAIRGFETITMYFNAISGFLLSTESNVWLILLTIIFYLKENSTDGTLGTALRKQTHGEA